MYLKSYFKYVKSNKKMPLLYSTLYSPINPIAANPKPAAIRLPVYNNRKNK